MGGKWPWNVGDFLSSAPNTMAKSSMKQVSYTHTVIDKSMLSPVWRRSISVRRTKP